MKRTRVDNMVAKMRAHGATQVEISQFKELYEHAEFFTRLAIGIYRLSVPKIPKASRCAEKPEGKQDAGD